jgi:hypothetical protein
MIEKNTIESLEIYRYIVVYKNLFKDIDKTFSTIQESLTNQENRVFTEWSKWSSFGEYLNPITTMVDWESDDIEENILKIDGDENQKNIILDIIKSFFLATKDYTERYGIDLDETTKELSHDKELVSTWQWSPPVICKYDHIVEPERIMTMRYHSDYIWEPITSPGHKFAITSLAYFNDDYVGGEIDFLIGNKLIKYKPEAGDVVFFPSGNPKFLTENDKVYLHGVLPVVEGNNKYFSRMFWHKYEYGSNEWYEKEEEFGKEEWKDMQDKIMKDFRKDHPQRSVILDGVRIK